MINPNENEEVKEAAATAPILSPPPRRVGVFTLGISLIASGAFLLYNLLVGAFDVFIVMKWTPLIFILLGCEVLYAHFTAKDRKLKYDFFSGVLCVLLAGICICTSGISVALEYYGPRKNSNRTKNRE